MLLASWEFLRPSRPSLLCSTASLCSPEETPLLIPARVRTPPVQALSAFRSAAMPGSQRDPSPQIPGPPLLKAFVSRPPSKSSDTPCISVPFEMSLSDMRLCPGFEKIPPKSSAGQKQISQSHMGPHLTIALDPMGPISFTFSAWLLVCLPSWFLPGLTSFPGPPKGLCPAWTSPPRSTVRGRSLLRGQLGVNPERAQGKQDGTEGQVTSKAASKASPGPCRCSGAGMAPSVLSPEEAKDGTSW